MELSVHSVTWNVNGRTPLESFNWSSLLDVSGQPLPDFYAIGFQESTSWLKGVFQTGEDPWTSGASRSLQPHGYVKLKTIRMVGIILSLFCLRHHLPFVRQQETRSTKMGFWGLGSKGCVSHRLTIYGVSVCFINAHLSAHDFQLDQRILEYNTIIKEHTYNNEETKEILAHNYVIWAGDLNFRLEAANLSHRQLVQKIQSRSFSELFELDQLHRAMINGTAFGEFKESPLDFPPTYKFDKAEYNPKRNPAWTDRIVYRVNDTNRRGFLAMDIVQESYTSHTSRQFHDASDHLPVSATFKLSAFDDEMAEKRGPRQFAPSVDFLLGLKGENQTVWPIGQAFEVHYKVHVADPPQLSQSDYIGLYEEKFHALDDYLTYCWALPLSQTRSKKSCTLTHSGSPGSYLFVYISSDDSILGMSRPILFE